jgi:hypothetical protein
LEWNTTVIVSRVLAAWILIAPIALVPQSADALDRPGTPTNVSMRATSPTTLEMSWHDTENHGEYVRYEFDYTKNGQAFAGPQPWGLWGAAPGLTTYTADLLEPEQRYCFQVWTRNTETDVRSQLPSGWACADTPPYSPAAPLVFDAFVRPKQHNAVLSWKTPEQSGHRPVQRFDVERRSTRSSDGPIVAEGQVAGPNGDRSATATLAFTFVSSALEFPTTEQFRVCSVNNGGRSCTAFATVYEKPFNVFARPPSALVNEFSARPATRVAETDHARQYRLPPAPPVADVTAGTFDTDFGVLNMGRYSGTYAHHDGKVTVAGRGGNAGNILDGDWEESSGTQRCVDGRYRGHFHFEFDQAGFTGGYGYCDAPANAGPWNGRRR